MKKNHLAIIILLIISSTCLSDKIKEQVLNDSSIENTFDPIDVVIPAHKKDLKTLDMVITGIKKNGKNIRRIIVVSKRPYTNKAEWFDEASYPFSKNDVLETIIQYILDGKQIKFRRLGWIYQQFLKLYAPLVIPDISPNVLVLDADTIFLNPVEFIDKQGYALYNVGREYHRPYFRHAQKLISDNPIVKIFKNYSGICHHMLFQRPIIEELFDCIEKTHKLELWKAIIKCINRQHLFGASFSEYEIYFNFVFGRQKRVKIRSLKWKNIKLNIDKLKECRAKKYHYVSCHSYLKMLIQLYKQIKYWQNEFDDCTDSTRYLDKPLLLIKRILF